MDNAVALVQAYLRVNAGSAPAGGPAGRPGEEAR
jgi:hypothetical protein